MPQIIRDIETFWVTVPLPAPVSDATSYTIQSSGMLVVRLVTDGGMCGYGITYSMNIAPTISEFIHRVLKPVVVGKDPQCYRQIWNGMYSALTNIGRKGLELFALSAIDIAVWDLRGRLLGLPIFKLLGGCERFIPAYASGGWISSNIEETVEEVRQRMSEGYTVVKIKIGVESGKNPREDARRVEAVRKAVGDKTGLIVDANGIWDAATAIRFAGMVADYDVSLFEEPVHADDIPGLRRVRESVPIPVGSGENEFTRYGVRDLVLGHAADVVQCDISRAGGYTEMQQISAITQAWNLKLAPHAWEFASAHLLSSAPHGLYLEKLPIHEPICRRVMPGFPTPKNGLFEIPDKPGLGFEFDLEFLQKNNLLSKEAVG